MTRKWLPVLLILLGGWGLLEALSYQAGLGNYARSPQRLQLSQGLTAIVGGGRAGLVFMEDRFRKRAQLLVRCEEGRYTIQLRRGQVSDELCGVRVELIDIMAGGRVSVVVRWGPDSQQSDAADQTAKEAAADGTGTEETAAEETGADESAKDGTATDAPAAEEANPGPAKPGDAAETETEATEGEKQ